MINKLQILLKVLVASAILLRLKVKKRKIGLKVKENEGNVRVKTSSQDLKLHYLILQGNYNKYLYYSWIHQCASPKVIRSSNIINFAKFQHAPTNHSLRFTHMAYTSIANLNLMWKDFVDFFS